VDSSVVWLHTELGPYQCMCGALFGIRPFYYYYYYYYYYYFNKSNFSKVE